MSLNNDPPPRRYHFFILGLWEQPDSRLGKAETWRISLENSQTAERMGFTNLAELEAFLHAWMTGAAEGDR